MYSREPRPMLYPAKRVDGYPNSQNKWAKRAVALGVVSAVVAGVAHSVLLGSDSERNLGENHYNKPPIDAKPPNPIDTFQLASDGQRLPDVPQSFSERDPDQSIGRLKYGNMRFTGGDEGLPEPHREAIIKGLTHQPIARYAIAERTVRDVRVYTGSHDGGHLDTLTNTIVLTVGYAGDESSIFLTAGDLGSVLNHEAAHAVFPEKTISSPSDPNYAKVQEACSDMTRRVEEKLLDKHGSEIADTYRAVADDFRQKAATGLLTEEERDNYVAAADTLNYAAETVVPEGLGNNGEECGLTTPSEYILWGLPADGPVKDPPMETIYFDEAFGQVHALITKVATVAAGEGFGCVDDTMSGRDATMGGAPAIDATPTNHPYNNLGEAFASTLNSITQNPEYVHKCLEGMTDGEMYDYVAIILATVKKTNPGLLEEIYEQSPAHKKVVGDLLKRYEGMQK